MVVVNLKPEIKNMKIINKTFTFTEYYYYIMTIYNFKFINGNKIL